MKIYTGIGSRSTPNDVLRLMTRTASRLEQLGWFLRSGGAKGADTAFELGTKTKEVYYAKDGDNTMLQSIASKFHPKWNILPIYVKQLMARNVLQVIGRDLNTPSHMVICWTPDGCESDSTRSITTGGTGLAISIADYYKIPIYNLANTDRLIMIADRIKSLNDK